MDKLISLVPESLLCYWALALSIPLAVRIGISCLEAIRLEIRGGCWKIFKGFGGDAVDWKKAPADYWLSYILGVGEMLAYPLLIAASQPLFIGFWLTFKTVHRWSYAPHFPRGPYNLYLVANAVILMGAYLSARVAVGLSCL